MPARGTKRGRRSRQEPTVRPARRDRPGPGERIGPACPVVAGSGGCRPLPWRSIRPRLIRYNLLFIPMYNGLGRASRGPISPRRRMLPRDADVAAPARPATLGAPLRVQRCLLLRSRERPGRAGTPIGAKDETQLLGRSQPIGMIRTERRAGLRLGQRTEQVMPEEAVLTSRHTGSVTGHGRWFLSTSIRRPRGSKQAASIATIGLLAIPAKNIRSGMKSLHIGVFISMQT